MQNSELYEKKKHGTADFPMQYYYVDESYYQYVMPLHWHKEFEIIRVISGSFDLFVNSVEYRLGAGDIAFINCGHLHRGYPQNAVYECLVFDLNMMLRRTDDILSQSIIPIISGEKCVVSVHSDRGLSVFCEVLSLFDEARERKDHFELAVYSHLFKIFSELYRSDMIRSSFSNKRSQHRADVVAKLLKYIETNFTEQITLEDLSRISGWNKKYICRLLCEYTNKTPIDYINTLRVENACREMTIDNKTVTEAAFDSGFNDLSYFSRTFKKYKGMTAKSYKSEHSGK